MWHRGLGLNVRVIVLCIPVALALLLVDPLLPRAVADGAADRVPLDRKGPSPARLVLHELAYRVWDPRRSVGHSLVDAELVNLAQDTLEVSSLCRDHGGPVVLVNRRDEWLPLPPGEGDGLGVVLAPGDTLTFRVSVQGALPSDRQACACVWVAPIGGWPPTPVCSEPIDIWLGLH